MSLPDPSPQPVSPPTAGPNFGTVVILFVATILIILVAAVFFLHGHSSKVVPHQPNPAPNSRLIEPGPAAGRILPA